jgi:hypothetical protein
VIVHDHPKTTNANVGQVPTVGLDSAAVLANKELIGTVDATAPELFLYTMSTP